MRALLVFRLILCRICASGFTTAQLAEELDARWLTDREKCLPQLGLAFAGVCNGMIDGAWEPGSQRAQERFTLDEGRTGLVSSADRDPSFPVPRRRWQKAAGPMSFRVSASVAAPSAIR